MNQTIQALDLLNQAIEKQNTVSLVISNKTFPLFKMATLTHYSSSFFENHEDSGGDI